MLFSGWGNYPKVQSDAVFPISRGDLRENVFQKGKGTCIARGLGRSYGDSSLAPNIISTRHLDRYISFDPEDGILTCDAGVSLADIVETFVPKGWFLPVTPGTKFVTIGGAIASDVHGKNHHRDGSFSDHVLSFRMLLPSGDIVNSSRSENTDLFCATCGGMGLTGIITDATFKLKPIGSAYIDETIIKAENLDVVLDLFDAYDEATYSVAWIDCLSTGSKLGRSILLTGEHLESGPLLVKKPNTLSVPIDMPGFLLNRFSVSAFNFLYYHKSIKKETRATVCLEPFFYPLDTMSNWNRLYGKKGFTQYQFVIPKSAGRQGLSVILKRIADSKRGSFLAVLKVFGKGNENPLSFPMEGYTLALDFKLEQGLFSFFNELDNIVTGFGGRLYLAKDVRMSESTFKLGYPEWEKFQQVRKKYQSDTAFSSLQAKRLGL